MVALLPFLQGRSGSKVHIFVAAGAAVRVIEGIGKLDWSKCVFHAKWEGRWDGLVGKGSDAIAF